MFSSVGGLRGGLALILVQTVVAAHTSTPDPRLKVRQARSTTPAAQRPHSPNNCFPLDLAASTPHTHTHGCNPAHWHTRSVRTSCTLPATTTNTHLDMAHVSVSRRGRLVPVADPSLPVCAAGFPLTPPPTPIHPPTHPTIGPCPLTHTYTLACRLFTRRWLCGCLVWCCSPLLSMQLPWVPS